MQFSFYTDGNNFELTNGYSVAAYGIIQSLKKLGHNVWFNSAKPPVQFNFCQPIFFQNVIRPEQYNIALTPWESTCLPPNWREIFDECDEIWATSPWVKEIYENLGLNVSEVYEHGITTDWKPLRRKVDGKINFLHHGSESDRKGGQETVSAFKDAFGNSDKVHLYLKCNKYTLARTAKGIPNESNITIVGQTIEQSKLIEFYHKCHVNVYPSASEGFGYSPAQSLATGMPTICTAEWASYKDFLGPLALNSKKIDSPWPIVHPGQLYKPDHEQLIELLKHTVDNYDALSSQFYRQSFAFHAKYDWLSLTENAFEKVFNKFA